MDHIDFDVELQKHLNKCELEFRAKQLPKGSNVEWLAPHCNSVQDIAEHLRYIGFKIREVVDHEDCAGDKHQWVITTSGVIVYVNSDGCPGLVAAACKPDSRKK